MKLGCILLARLDSSRLPGKQFKIVKGRTLMDYILERVIHIRDVEQVVLATSDRGVDDPLAEWARANQLECYRGPVDDVAGRVLGCMKYFGFDSFVRINCDSPLLDFNLLSKGVEIFLNGGYDIVTNTFPRSFPVGHSVEIISLEAFSRGYARMNEPGHFEHVTKYFYEHPYEYDIYNMVHNGPSLQRISLAVDTRGDLERYERLMGNMTGSHLDYTGGKLVRLYDAVMGNDSSIMGKEYSCDISAPLVTVYITNYNYGRYISEAVESVLNQTFSDFEVIIIDDCSTDQSREIIKQYETNPKVRIIYQEENKGLNRNNNIALKASRGKYIMRLDADDKLDPNALLVMSRILDTKSELGMVFPDYYYIDSEGNVIGQERRHNFKKEVTLKDQPAHGACTMIRKRALLSVGGYSEEHRCQDGYDLWLRFIEKHDIDNVNLPLFYYRRHDRNLTNDNRHLLETRARIKEDHAKRSKTPPLQCLAVLPARGRPADPGCLALETLGSKKLIDWTIEAALEAKSIKMLVVTTPDDVLLEHVRKNYGNSVIAHSRPLEYARENVPLEKTLGLVLEQCGENAHLKAMALLTVETPFRSSMYLDKAANTARIFEIDSVIGVVPDNDLFFHHNGTGLNSVGFNRLQNNLRLERDYLYRKVLGFHLIRRDFFQSRNKTLGGRIGHVMFDPLDAFAVRNKLDLEVADFLFRKQKLNTKARN